MKLHLEFLKNLVKTRSKEKLFKLELLNLKKKMNSSLNLHIEKINQKSTWVNP